MSYIRQTSFLGGELAPALWGRTELPSFASGLRTMRNFFPSRHGAAVSRPGTQYAGKPRSGGARLIPFVFSDSESYVVEVGNLPPILGVGGYERVYFRFLRLGEYDLQSIYLDITNPGGLTGFTPGLVVTSGSASATLLAVTPPFVGHPASLRLGNVSGTFYDGTTITDSGVGSATIIGTTYTAPLEVFVWKPDFAVGPELDLSLLKYSQVGDILTLTHPLWWPRELRRLPDVEGGWPHWEATWCQLAPKRPVFPDNYWPLIESPLPTPDDTHPAREWEWRFSLTARDVASGALFETQAIKIYRKWNVVTDVVDNMPSKNLVAVYPDKPVTIYQEFNPEAPEIPPPDGTWRAIAINYYRGRGRLFGFIGTTITGGSSNPFVDTGAEPNYAIQPSLGNSPLDYIFSLEGGVLLPYEFPYAVAFFQERRVFAATHRRPSTLFFSKSGDYTNYEPHRLIQVAGQALEYEIASRRYEEVVHLFDAESLLVFTKSSVFAFAGAGGNPIDFDSVDCHQIDGVGCTQLPPLRIDDAVLFARAKGSGVRALAMDQGGNYRAHDVSWIASHLFSGVPLAEEKRRLVDWTYAEDPWGLIWAVRDDGTLLSATVFGESVGWAHHDTNGRVRSICAIPEGDEDRVYMLVERQIDGQPAYCIERMASRVRTGDPYYDDICVDSSVIRGGLSASPFGNFIVGLEHLKGKEVYVVSVGQAPLGPYLVDELGEIHVPPGAPVITNPIHVGLPFTAELETLDAITTATRLRQKNILSVGFELSETAGIVVGPDFAHLSESQPHTVESGYSAPSLATGVVRVNVRGKWDVSSRAVLRQALPLPVTVVGVVREIDLGE